MSLRAAGMSRSCGLSSRVAGADERAQVELEEQHHGCEREMIEETIIRSLCRWRTKTPVVDAAKPIRLWRAALHPGRQHAHAPVAAPSVHTCGQGTGAVLQPPVSATDDKVFYRDGNTNIKFLTPDGQTGSATIARRA